MEGVGIAIVWQDGPLGEQPASTAPVFRMGAQQAFPPDVPGHNGAFVEGVLAAAQDSPCGPIHAAGKTVVQQRKRPLVAGG